MNELVGEWLAKAEEDWRSANVLLDDQSPLITPALFHMQQCAEKLLKALLIKKKTYFERRHDLSYLLGLVGERPEEEEASLIGRIQGGVRPCLNIS